MNYLIFKVN